MNVREGRSWALDVTAAVNKATGNTAFRLSAAMNYGAPGWMSYAGRTHAETAIRPRLVVRQGSAPASYEDWWSGAPETPPELRAPAGDASGNGQPNIIAFLRGLSPLAAAPAPALSLHKDDSGLFLRWQQDTRVSTIPYRLEWNDGFDPEDWIPVILEYRYAHPAETGDIRTLEVDLEQVTLLRIYRLRIDTDFPQVNP